MPQPVPIATANMASQVATAPPPNDPQNQTMKPTRATPDSYFFSLLKSQVEFYFSPPNLARDTYLRGLMAQYGGALVPLSVIASFPKVRELCATKTGNAAIPADPILLMRALDGSKIAKVSPDAYWISPLMPLPPLVPTTKQRHTSQPLTRQVSAGSNAITTVRTSSPLSNASSSEARSSRTTLIVSDLPTELATEVVMTAFTSDNVIPKTAKPSDGNVWLVTFASEQDALSAISASTDKLISGHPIRAKIMNEQSKGAPSNNNGHANNNNNSKPSPTTTALPQEGFGESDSAKQQQQQQTSPNRHVAVQQLPVQQATHAQYTPVPHMAIPQGMPTNNGGAAYPYPYTFQTPVQYTGARYPPHLQPPAAGPHAIPYAPPMYGHGHPYQYMQSAPRPFYTTGPNQPSHVFIRSATDPGQMRPNPNHMSKTKNDGSNKNMMRKNIKNRKGQQGFIDGYGGMNPMMSGQRTNKGSAENLAESIGINDMNRKGAGRSKDSGQGVNSRRKTNSPILHSIDSFEGRSSNKGKKKKSKRRGSATEWDRRREPKKTEIFDENMFPALSPSKSKASNEGNGNIPAPANATSNGFSGYADALRQKNKPKSFEAETENGKHQESNPETLGQSVAALNIANNVDESPSIKASSIDDPTTVIKSIDAEVGHTSGSTTETFEKSSFEAEVNRVSPVNVETKPIVTSIEPTPKEASKITVKPVPETETVSTPKDNTIPVKTENDTSNTTVETETEINSAPVGAWGEKRSFIDIVKRQS